MLLLWIQHTQSAQIIGLEIFAILLIVAALVWWRGRRM